MLVGLHPNGTILFTSLPYPGKISDEDITCKTLLCLELLDSGDDVMCGQGFTMAHVLYALGIGHVAPPRKKNGVVFFSEEQTILTSKVAGRKLNSRAGP